MTKKSKRIEIDKEAQLVWQAEEEEFLRDDLVRHVLRIFDGRVVKQEEGEIYKGIYKCIDCSHRIDAEQETAGGLCDSCKRDREEDEQRNTDHLNDLDLDFCDEEEDHPAEEKSPTPKKRGGQTHEGLLRGDQRYLEKSEVREPGDPVEILNDTFSYQDRMIPGYPKKKKLHSWDLITFLGYYGAEKFLGHSLASFLPKLLVFKHDSIFVSSRSLLAQCGMSQQSKKLVSKLFRPWCLRCCAGGRKCDPDRHDWQPPLFFRERKFVKKSRHYRTYLRPNRGAFHVLVLVLMAARKQTVEEFHVPVEEKAEKYEEKKRRASRAREAKGKK